MQDALLLAKQSLDNNDYPIGCILVIDKQAVASSRSQIRSQKNWSSHAELTVLNQNSQLIREKKLSGSQIELFTTVEPCLMCFGASHMHRVDRIIYGCTDPSGGMSMLTIQPKNSWHQDRLPKLQQGPLHDECKSLMISFLKKQKGSGWDKMLQSFL